MYNVGVRNVNDAISASTIAEGALNSLKEISQRQLELTEQAANGTYSTKQGQALNTEANALVDEYNRIVSSTTFNGLSLFDPKLGSVLIQAGNSTLSEGFSNKLSRAAGDGTFSAASSFEDDGRYPSTVSVGDLNGDGVLDVVTGNYYGNITVSFGNADGKFQKSKSYYNGAGALSIAIADVNGDGKADLVSANFDGDAVSVFLNNGDGSFGAPAQFSGASTYAKSVALGDFNGDGKLDLVVNDTLGHSTGVLLGNGNGTFQAVISYSGGGIGDTILSDLNGDGRLDIISADTSGNVDVLFGNSNGTFSDVHQISANGAASYVTTADVNGDGAIDIVTAQANSAGTVSVLLGNGNGSFQSAKSFSTGSINLTSVVAGDFNSDGLSDIAVTAGYNGTVDILLGNGNGTFSATRSFVTGGQFPNQLAVGDVNGDGRSDLVTADYGSTDFSVFIGNGKSSSGSKYLNLNSRAFALDSQAIVNGNLDGIESQLGSLGASGSRFQTALNNLQVQSQNFVVAASRIQDADVAQESSVLVRTQILQQAAASVLAQANQQPSLALRLLK